MKPTKFTFVIEVEVVVYSDSKDKAKTLAEDAVLSGHNGCEVAILKTDLESHE